MDKLILPFSFFLVLSTLTFTGCKKDKTTKDLLIGKWNVVFEKETRYQNNVISNVDSWNNPPGDFVLQFFADGTGKFYEKTLVSASFIWELTTENKLFVTTDTQSRHEVVFTVNESSITWKETFTYNLNGIEYKIEEYKEGTRTKS